MGARLPGQCWSFEQCVKSASKLHFRIRFIGCSLARLGYYGASSLHTRRLASRSRSVLFIRTANEICFKTMFSNQIPIHRQRIQFTAPDKSGSAPSFRGLGLQIESDSELQSEGSKLLIFASEPTAMTRFCGTRREPYYISASSLATEITRSSSEHHADNRPPKQAPVST